MAFISSKNFLAPFTNKVHIVTLVLVAVVFAVFRLSGGSIEKTSYKDNRSASKSFNDDLLDDIPRPVSFSKREGTKKSNSSSENYFLMEQYKKQENEAAKREKSPRSKGTNINDLYESLK